MRKASVVVIVALTGCARSTTAGPSPAASSAAEATPPPAAVSASSARQVPTASATAQLAAEPASGPPVAGGPLSGQIAGKKFTGKSALATEDKSFPSTRTIIVYDGPSDCLHDGPQGKGARQLYVHAPWPPAGPAPLRDSGFVVDTTPPTGFEVTSGRVEMQGPAPKVGERGKVRIRATSVEHKLQLEGEIEYVLCEYRAR